MKDAKIIAPTTIKPSLFDDTQRCKIREVKKNKSPYMHSCAINKRNKIAEVLKDTRQYPSKGDFQIHRFTISPLFI